MFPWTTDLYYKRGLQAIIKARKKDEFLAEKNYVNERTRNFLESLCSVNLSNSYVRITNISKKETEGD